MLTDLAVTSITVDLALSPHERQSVSRTPRRESATSNATRVRPHTATAETGTPLGVFNVTGAAFQVVELAPGVEYADVVAKTAAPVVDRMIAAI